VLTKAALPMTPIKYFRIRLMTSEEVAATTTIPVYAEMFIGDVLELVSRKRKLDPNEYILTIPDSNVVIPNDTPVDGLKEVEELTLTKKTATLTVPHSSSNPLWRSPIKKRKEDPHSPMYFNTGDDNKQPSDNFLQQYKVKTPPLFYICIHAFVFLEIQCQSQNPHVCRKTGQCPGD
jgi:hypothetical protein